MMSSTMVRIATAARQGRSGATATGQATRRMVGSGISHSSRVCSMSISPSSAASSPFEPHHRRGCCFGGLAPSSLCSSPPLGGVQNGTAGGALFPCDRPSLAPPDSELRAIPSPPRRRHASFFGPPATAGTTTTPDPPWPPLPEWHDPRFMEGRSAEEKERWLEGLLGISASMSLSIAESGDHRWSESEESDGGDLGSRRPSAGHTPTRRRKEGGGRARNRIDVEAYNVVLRGWAGSDSPAAPFRAEEWLCRLRGEAAEDRDEGEVAAMEPDVESYNAVLEAWSKCGEAISVVRAERWLKELEDRRSSLLARIDDPSTSNVGGDADAAADAAAEMLERMGPNTRSYNLFLSTCARGLARHDEARLSHALLAHDALHRMLGDGGDHAVDDDGEGGAAASSSSSTTAATATRLCRPDTESFNRVMTAWTRCRREPTVAVRVMELLRTMEEMQRRDQERDGDLSSPADPPRVRPNTQSYCIAMNAWGIAAEQRARESRVGRHRPAAERSRGGYDERRRRGEDGPRKHFDGMDEVLRAEAILSYMHDIRDGGNPDVVPNTVAYNSLIAAFARTVDADNAAGCLGAERVLREMIDVSESDPNVAPDHVSYSTIIHAWVKTKKLNSTKRAEWWLRRMWKRHEEATRAEERDNVAPTAFTYNTVIRSWCDRGDAARADALLGELLDLERRRQPGPEGEEEEGGEDGRNGDGGDSVPPQIFANSDTYALVIGAWVRHEAGASARAGGDAGKGCERAERLLLDLIDREERGLPGNTTARELYNNVLKAASLSASRSRGVLNVAIRTFARLDESRHVADNLSYKMLLQTGLRVLARSPDDAKRRGKFVRYVITECCSNGVLCRGIVNALANSSVYKDGWTADERDGLVEELLGEWPIPQSWTRNLSEPGIAPVRKDFRWIEEVDDDPPTERIKY